MEIGGIGPFCLILGVFNLFRRFGHIRAILLVLGVLGAKIETLFIRTPWPLSPPRSATLSPARMPPLSDLYFAPLYI